VRLELPRATADSIVVNVTLWNLMKLTAAHEPPGDVGRPPGSPASARRIST
jgi:hypothetical protein